MQDLPWTLKLQDLLYLGHVFSKHHDQYLLHAFEVLFQRLPYYKQRPPTPWFRSLRYVYPQEIDHAFI